MTPGQSADGHPAATKCTMLIKCLDGVLRTGWCKATIAPHPGTEKELIAPDDLDQQPGDHWLFILLNRISPSSRTSALSAVNDKGLMLL